MKALITGFEPFGGEEINPAWQAVLGLKRVYGDTSVVIDSLPVVFQESIAKLNHLIDLHRPDIVICVGQAGGRSQFALERVAINLDDARMPDNLGKTPVDQRIVENGPDAYFSKLPIKAIVETLRKKGIPSGVSNTAGTYVCNHVMYGLLHRLSQEEKPIKGGFVHVPYAPEQVIDKPGQSFMTVSMITKALEFTLEVTVSTNEDIKKADHAIH